MQHNQLLHTTDYQTLTCAPHLSLTKKDSKMSNFSYPVKSNGCCRILYLKMRESLLWKRCYPNLNWGWINGEREKIKLCPSMTPEGRRILRRRIWGRRIRRKEEYGWYYLAWNFSIKAKIIQINNPWVHSCWHSSGQVNRKKVTKMTKLVEDSRPKDFWVFLAETESTQRTETFMAVYE